jgi:4a-hydroxytetrahydrobiopterin dehydratase
MRGWPGQVTGVAQRTSEAELVPVGVGQVEKAFAPRRVPRCGVRPDAVFDGTCVNGIDVRHVEDDAPPPTPQPLFGLGGKVEEARTGAETGEPRGLTAVDQVKAQRGVESHRARHIVGCEGYRTDALDHRDDALHDDGSGDFAMTAMLAEKTCTPCRGGIPPLTPQEAEQFRVQAPDWALRDETTRIERTYRFKNFAEAFAFVRSAGELAEAEAHHPDISFGWGYATVSLRTKKIKGLHENDFIMAVKLDRIAADAAA